MPFIRNERGALVWKGDHFVPDDFRQKALAMLGINDGDGVESRGREPTLGERINGTPKDKNGLVTGTVAENLFNDNEDPRGVQYPNTTTSPEIKQLYRQTRQPPKHPNPRRRHR